ncbi:MAG TPA: TIGR03118 family protein [Casimicrobiaceae bacterium]|nr:TIGR03118 family protein [Casimicrobiaceae bacterium]
MGYLHRHLALAALIGAALLATTTAGFAAGYVETDLVVNQQVNNVPTLTDKNGIVHVAKFFDPNLVNPWGVGESSGSPFWVSDNNNGTSSLYNTAGTPQSLVVAIPAPGDPLGTGGTPTGLVFNIAAGQNAFKVSGVSAAGAQTMAPAAFLFAAEDGTILGWNPGVNPPNTPAASRGKHAIIAVDHSAVPDAADGAVYKGLAIAKDSVGNAFLYATNFRAGTVDVYNAAFQQVTLPPNAFVDPHLPRGYAPFNIVLIGNRLFVTYAVQNAEKHDDVAGQSHGIVDTFDLAGNMLARFAQHGQLDSPWGVAQAPAGFGQFSGEILIGNFGNGHINAFDPATGEFLDKVRDPHGQAIVIDGLWTITFGNGGNGGDRNTLYFTAGPNDESDGLFGSLAPNE